MTRNTHPATPDTALSRRLCALADVPDGGSAGFDAATADEPVGILAVRRAGTLWLYVNRCPHVRLPLDFQPGQFLDRSKTRILCANHGALFDIESGACVGGPCTGHSLITVAHRIDDAGDVWIPERLAL